MQSYYRNPFNDPKNWSNYNYSGSYRTFYRKQRAKRIEGIRNFVLATLFGTLGGFVIAMLMLQGR